ncbi:hypothetical protein F4680DRAFT_463348 [Xylaria scruposa]|nr:hypothetical protein F4680DRAFT_463348 [Xylaria scruposa]
MAIIRGKVNGQRLETFLYPLSFNNSLDMNFSDRVMDSQLGYSSTASRYLNDTGYIVWCEHGVKGDVEHFEVLRRCFVNGIIMGIVVNNFPVESYSRDVYDLEGLMLRHLQQKVPALAQDPKLWIHIFAAMVAGVEVAVDITDGEKEYYKHQVDKMSWDWFNFPPSLGGRWIGNSSGRG